MCLLPSSVLIYFVFFPDFFCFVADSSTIFGVCTAQYLDRRSQLVVWCRTRAGVSSFGLSLSIFDFLGWRCGHPSDWISTARLSQCLSTLGTIPVALWACRECSRLCGKTSSCTIEAQNAYEFGKSTNFFLPFGSSVRVGFLTGTNLWSHSHVPLWCLVQRFSSASSFPFLIVSTWFSFDFQGSCWSVASIWHALGQSQLVVFTGTLALLFCSRFSCFLSCLLLFEVVDLLQSFRPSSSIQSRMEWRLCLQSRASQLSKVYLSSNSLLLCWPSFLQRIQFRRESQLVGTVRFASAFACLQHALLQRVSSFCLGKRCP